jgi:hypothetical protein
MKRLLSILAVIFFLAILFVFILPPIQKFFGLSDQATHWLSGAIGVPLAWLALYGVPSFSWLSGVPRKLLIFRFIGILIAVIGGILVFGNRTGLFLTFPFAGTVALIIGVFIFYFAGKVE